MKPSTLDAIINDAVTNSIAEMSTITKQTFEPLTLIADAGQVSDTTVGIGIVSSEYANALFVIHTLI